MSKAKINITGTDAVIALGEEIAARLRAICSTDRIKTDHKGNVLCEQKKRIVVYPGEGYDKKGQHFFDALCTVDNEDTILQSFSYPDRDAFVQAVCDAVSPYIGHRVKRVKYRKKFRYYGMSVSYELPSGDWKEFDSFRVEGFFRNLFNIRTDETTEITEYQL